MKRKKKLVLCMIMLSILLLSGCQKTPDKSSVVSKADGLAEELIAEPLKLGEKRTIDIPEHWSAEVKKSNDRVTISADLDLGKLETGNLPVVEMANHTMTQEELEKLVEYFSDDEELYVPQADTKDVFQKLKDRITNREGGYANPSRTFTDLVNSLEEAIKLAPETSPEAQKAEVKFQKKSKDVVQEALNSRYTKLSPELEQNTESEIFFEADVGEDRQCHIKAECYDPEVVNSSRFVWKTGTTVFNSDYIQSYVRMNEYNTNDTEYKEKFRERLNQLQNILEQQPFSVEEGQKQAEKLVKDLNISDISLSSVDKKLWFPEGEMADVKYGEAEDSFWEADLEKAKVGYEYVFTSSNGGISAGQSIGWSEQDTSDTYTAPFPIEEVSIAVTEDGVKTFSWEGVSEEVSTIADNVKLLPFEEIQEQLFEQIFYNYLSIGQPKEDTTNFIYKITSAKLGYTYVTAFDKPDNAWMVPTWFFQVMRSDGQAEDMKDLSVFPVSINAMDGGVIVQSSN